jgi:tellurite resistance protein TerC
MPLSLWIGFNLFVLGMVALDLGFFHRDAHEVGLREAVRWTCTWIALALLFNLGLYFYAGPQKALEFLTAYLVEKSLSVDNIFVFLVLFSSFNIAPRYQHRILVWGILGALVLRGLFIAVGITLIHQFHWILYIFGAGLVITGLRMAFKKRSTDPFAPSESRGLALLRRWLPVSDEQEGGHFFVKYEGRWKVTSLFVVLLLIEATDVVFAADSIPAVLAVSLDPFIVYASNIFAVLGLRALYFVLSGMIPKFHYLHYGLSAILVALGMKMLLSDILALPFFFTLAIIMGLLAGSVAASLLWPSRPLSEKEK